MGPGSPDLSFLERLCKGDRVKMSAFIEQYLADSPQLYRMLEEASANSDATALAHAAHDLRPHAHYIGAQEVQQLLVTIDQAARQRPPVIRHDLVGALMLKVGPLNDALRAEIDRTGTP